MFLLIPFSNIKKDLLLSLKIPGKVFLLILSLNIKKANLGISNNLAQSFCLSPFHILKKHTYESRNTGTGFLLIPFLNIKKTYLQILKYLAQFFYSSPFQILKKKHTYESQNTWRSFFTHPLFHILKKTYL